MLWVDFRDVRWAERLKTRSLVDGHTDCTQTVTMASSRAKKEQNGPFVESRWTATPSWSAFLHPHRNKVEPALFRWYFGSTERKQRSAEKRQ